MLSYVSRLGLLFKKTQLKKANKKQKKQLEKANVKLGHPTNAKKKQLEKANKKANAKKTIGKSKNKANKRRKQGFPAFLSLFLPTKNAKKRKTRKISAK